MAKLEYQHQQIHLIGQIDFQNAEKIYQQGLALIRSEQKWPLMINLSKLEHGSTLALAVFIQWLRACPDLQSLCLTQVPKKMQGILQASHLEQLVID